MGDALSPLAAEMFDHAVEAVAHAGRALLGKGNALVHGASRDQITTGDWRNPENWFFQVGMGIIFVGFCCGWLTQAHNLVRYKYCVPMRFCFFLGHLILAIWGGIGGGDEKFKRDVEFIYLD